MYQELIGGLLSLFPLEIERIVLFGSMARGDDLPDSDIDIALLLKRKLSPAQQYQLAEFIADMDLKYDRVFSVIDIDYETYLIWRQVTPFYKNVDTEGIVLWQAA